MKTTQDISNECINSISREEALKRADKDGYVQFERFGLIHIDNWKEKSDRELALEWWNNLDDSMKMNLCRIHFSMRSVSGISVIKSLTGREIEQIWRKETQQTVVSEIGTKEFNDVCTATFGGNLKEEKPQVDFEGLYKYIEAMNQLYDTTAIQNLCLFFELLSKSSSFAHKAHKELQRLNK
mgnify:CR=1 FL=1